MGAVLLDLKGFDDGALQTLNDEEE